MDFASSIIPFAIVLVVMYFVAIRPQQQEKAAHEQMLAGLAKDDRVVTTGGLHGRILEINADVLLVEISEKTKVRIDRSAVARKQAAPADEKR
jgi:preprotein translocase subunit YajC